MTTTIAVLPGATRVRAPEPADAEEIFELASAHNLSVTRVVASSLSDVADRISCKDSSPRVCRSA